ncbi:hypothetical protein K0M31_017109 [Melipona bicolor]|uniref:Uncharacterized protein n=1 Tax=Melipona bicolor TaxID=60889 RepID=A0AA40FDF0_9HYME|nr:hypothetical protein K0M31_017109 [Melipona bicolor]
MHTFAPVLHGRATTTAAINNRRSTSLDGLDDGAVRCGAETDVECYRTLAILVRLENQRCLRPPVVSLQSEEEEAEAEEEEEKKKLEISWEPKVNGVGSI